jgi:hypothetical protein
LKQAYVGQASVTNKDRVRESNHAQRKFPW